GREAEHLVADRVTGHRWSDGVDDAGELVAEGLGERVAWAGEVAPTDLAVDGVDAGGAYPHSDVARTRSWWVVVDGVQRIGAAVGGDHDASGMRTCRIGALGGVAWIDREQ